MTQNLKNSNLHTFSGDCRTPLTDVNSPTKKALRDPIAIIGIGCRFPGDANNPEAFWQLLRDGIDAISEVPAERFSLHTFYDPNRKKPGKTYSRWGGFIKDIDKFDAQFFGISPREAARSDPQQRLLLTVAWEALENAGLVPIRLAGSSTGVFIGISSHDYSDIQSSVSERHSTNAYTNLGGAMSIAANRISYLFNFQGPSMSVDTACSSSLVAVHLACQSIWNGESTLALAGGVNAILKPEMTIGFSKASMLSPDGRCKSFDARANGYVRAEGAGIVVLKPYKQAVADGDPIIALIRSTVVNQDGRTNGITVPSESSQTAMLQEAYRQAGVEPFQVQYVEAHGTGTPVGDPIEAKALGQVLSLNRPAGNDCFIGSVKSNIGHLESGSGIAGLIKAALCLKHGQIPSNLHFETPNPQIPFDQLQLRVPQRLEPWPAIPLSPTGRALRIAGVNSFGFGGTNAHVVLSDLEAPAVAPNTDTYQTKTQNEEPERAHLLLLSARSSEALRSLAQAYQDFLRDEATDDLSDICYSAALRRSHHEHRLALVATSKAEMAEHVDAFLAGESRLGISSGRTPSPPKIKKIEGGLVFVFSGMGQQWWAMGRQLLTQEPVFREVIERCDELLRPYLQYPGGVGWSLKEELTADESSSRINQTHIAQPALFSLQVALATLWRSWGISPSAIVGHSVGEVAAAHVAGVLSLPDAIQVIFHRSRLQAQTAGQGKMLAVGLSEEEALGLLVGFEARVSIAAINSSRAVTLSGDADALEQIANSLEPHVFKRFLRVEVPYHSPKMDPLKAELLSSLQTINPQPATIPLFSTVTGQATHGPEWDAFYWWQNVRNPVRFATTMDSLMQAGFDIFLEVSAHPVLANSMKECLAEGDKTVSDKGRKASVLPSLRRKKGERVMMLASLGHLYTLGYPIDWNHLYPKEASGRFPQDASSVRLPSYPWQPERYWNESEATQQARVGTQNPRLLAHHTLAVQQTHPLLGGKLQSVQPVWDVEIDQEYLTYLSDHRIQGAVVYPGAAYVEMALAAGEGIQVSQIEFHKALFLTSDPVTLQLIQKEDSFEIYSKAKDSWVRHATGKLSHHANMARNQNGQAPSPIRLDEIRRRLPTEISQSDCYRQFQEMGLQYGPSFQGIERLFRGGPTEDNKGEALAQLRIPDALLRDVEAYHLHPAILDACFQVLLGVVPQTGAQGVYLPVQIDRIHLFGRPEGHLWSYARLVTQSASHLSGDIQLLDGTGNVLVEIQGLRCQSLTGARSNKIDDYLYQYQWDLVRPGDEPTDYMPSPRQIAEAVEPEAARLSRLTMRNHFYEQVEPQLNALCTAYVHKAQEGWEVGQIPQAEEPQELWRTLLSQYPAYQAELTLLRQCGQQLAEGLRGEADPQEIIFSQNALSTIEHLYQDSPSYRFVNLLVQKAISVALTALPKEKTVRILEIGAGTGGMTSYLLPKLPSNRTEYLFTGLSDLLLTRAENKFRDYPFVQYQLLDIDLDLLDKLESAAGASKFDLILVSDDSLMSSDWRRTVENLKPLLASKGLLILLARTRATPWMTLALGLTRLPAEGQLTDANKANSWMPVAQWQELLSSIGFTEVAALSDSAETFGRSTHTVMMAQAPYIPPTPLALPPQKQGSWLIFADQAGIGQQLATRLSEQEQTPILIWPGSKFEHSGTHVHIHPEHPQEYEQLLTTLSDKPLVGIVHLWSLLEPPSFLEQSLGSVSLLHLVQALAKSAQEPALCLVTRGTQPVKLNSISSISSLSSPQQAPLWGLGRVIVNEQPNLRLKLVDLSLKNSDAEINSLFAELWVDDQEDEVALRGAARYVHRLRSISLAELEQDVQPRAALASRSTLPPLSYRLETSTPGIDHLLFRATTRQKPGTGEVEIQIYATGLNFKDVAKAMGLLDNARLEKTFSGRTLGLECAGKITAIGTGVEDKIKIGDEVFALAPNSFGTYTITDARFVRAKPTHLTFSEAATIPIVFLTAYVALHEFARLRAAERILIHSATGGVGLAALQLAKATGAEIFATAGNPQKRELLRVLGVKLVMDSRSLLFADEVMEYTNGQGVDVVLNTLPGETIASSMSTLRSGGRFIDISNIYTDSKVGLRAFQKGLSFFAFDLDQLMRVRPDFVGSLFREAMQYVSDKGLHPLPHRVFPYDNVVGAFRYMAQAKHIGKIVLSESSADVVVSNEEEKITFAADATYLITGGLSGFGLATATWMVENGARHLVLMGRSGASNGAKKAAVEALQEAGAQVTVAKADVTSEEQVANVLANISPDAPLRGIIHAANVYDDAFLPQLNQERFQKVMAPKVNGAWTLHNQTLNTPLDFFVLFSSVTSLVGNPGQANYVSANAFLDALAHYRHAQGLPALTINWGAVAEVGYVAKNRDVGEHLARIGINPLPPQQLLEVLGRLLKRQVVQIAVTAADWQKWAKNHAASRRPKFSHLVSQDWHKEDEHDHTTLDFESILEEVARVLGTSPKKLDTEQPLANLGLDSLMAVELTNALKNRLGVDVPTMKLMEGGSVAQLAKELLPETHTQAPQQDTKAYTPIQKEKTSVSSQPISRPAKKAVILAPESSTFIDILRGRALHQPNQRAYTFLVNGETKEIDLTYRELDRQARSIAAELQELGATGECALLLYPPGLSFIAAFFGCLYAGVVAVPTYPPRRNRLDHRPITIATDAQAKFVLTTTQILSARAVAPWLESLQWLATDNLDNHLASDWRAPDVSRETLAFLQYTSGSTGSPKGVMVTHSNLLHNSTLIHNSFEHTPLSRGVSWLPTYHDMGLIGGILQPVYVGAPMILMSPLAFLQKPFRWLQAISRYNATTSGGPNFAYDLCVRKIKPEQKATLDLSSWQVAFSGAEPVRAETVERFAATFASCGFRREAFYPCYGMAEATLLISGGLKTEPLIIQQVDENALLENRVALSEVGRAIVGCGHRFGDQKIIIVDPDSLTPCPDERVGEIWLSGPSVAQGYWNQPQKTKETFNAYLADSGEGPGEGPFLRTGDLGFLKKGELFITGRLKDLIIIRGRNHYPQDIELTVEQSHPALRENSGAAFSVEVKGEERLVVVQEVKPSEKRKDMDQVVANIRRAVTRQHQLQVYAVVLIKSGTIPKTSSGKIQRRACRTKFLAGSLDLIESDKGNVITS